MSQTKGRPNQALEATPGNFSASTCYGSGALQLLR